MKTKLIEIRDEATCIAALAILMEPANEIEQAFFSREGYAGADSVILMSLSDQEANCDPHSWSRGTRTMPWAHEWIRTHWDEIEEGSVVDVRVTQGMTTTPAEAEIFARRDENGERMFAPDKTLRDEHGFPIYDDMDKQE